MKVSLDISMYPLHKDYEPVIIDFIEKLKKGGFKIFENPLSTQIYGDYDAVTQFVNRLIKESFLSDDMVVFNMKYIKGDRS